MSKENFYTATLFFVLTISFILIGLLLLIFPDNRKLLSRKFKTGSMIISLTGILSLTQCSKPMCYDPVVEVPENTMSITNISGDTIVIDLSVDSMLNGIIENCAGADFSYSLLQNDSVVQTGQIFAADGKFDQYSEEFTIQLYSSLPPSVYSLQLKAGAAIMSTYIVSTF